MAHEKKLGRGLDFLLSETARESTHDELLLVQIDQIHPNPQQPRTEFNDSELQALTESIKTHGILQPLVARRTEKGFELIAGERRLRAAKNAGLEVVPLVTRDANQDQILALALVENIQREDLNPIEKAKALLNLLQLSGKTQEEVAKQVNISRPSLANLVRLLDLPEDVQVLVSRGTLSMGHARALLASEQQNILPLAQKCIENRWSVRQIEEKIRTPDQPTHPTQPTGPITRNLPPWHRELEERLTHALSTRVEVKFSGKRAKITIKTPDRDSFDHLFERLLALPQAPNSKENEEPLGDLLM